MTARLVTILLAVALVVGAAHAQHAQHAHDHEQAPSDAAPPLFDGLGDHRMPITVSAEARPFFDQGLLFVYGFDHSEAVRAFREASRLDPECAMCHWGLALALGPHINAPMAAEAVDVAYDAVDSALALATRYTSDPTADRRALDRAYADAMRDLSAAYPDDLDAATLFAEALMILMPWDYWAADGTPRPATVELLAVLEGVMARDPYHPGANHHYIHAVEASDRPERAVEADRAHFAAVEAEGLVPVLYHPHNLHFLAWTAGMEGRSDVALRAAAETGEAAFAELAHDLLFLNAFLTMSVQTMVRFEAWPEILAGGPREGAHAFETAIWHYAHGRALVALGELDDAHTAARSLAAALAAPDASDMEQPAAFFPGVTMLEIAHDVLDAHLARADGAVDAALTSLERAVARHDTLPYFEPPHWFVSPRLDLGWMLLEAGRAADAEAVLRDDLEVYAENGWALYGLAESLLAQGADTEAAEVQSRFEEAWRHADVAARPGTVEVGAARP